MYNDTIAAISTPPGPGGIGIVRLSGPLAPSILQTLFVPAARSRAGITPRRLMHGHVVDPTSGQQVDEVMAVYLAAPATYTREDMAEIQAHGGPVPLQSVLALCLAQGARLANPGEFTQRAFTNGRISLDQAEAVMDVVQARTQSALGLAVQQLDGRLATPVRAVRRRLVDVLAYLTACSDLPEEDIPAEQTTEPLRQCLTEVRGLLAGAEQGILYRQGVRVAILGRPNVGKSSLLNALLRQSRAIVTPVPGTTRDTIEETLVLKGLPLVLIDTAGINEDTGAAAGAAPETGAVDRLGMARSRQAAAACDLALLVLDSSEPLGESDRVIADLVTGKPVIVVRNKCDLLPAPSSGEIVTVAPTIAVSALTGQGLDALEEALVHRALDGQGLADGGWLVSSPRHRDALRRAERHLVAGLEALTESGTEDCAVIDLTAAANDLGEITGETAGEDILEAVFSRFCLGK